MLSVQILPFLVSILFFHLLQYSLNKIIFKVPDGANKKNLKKNIEKIFKVNVVKVNTINIREKSKLVRNKKSYKPGYKKAIVTLKQGEVIDLGA